MSDDASARLRALALSVLLVFSVLGVVTAFSGVAAAGNFQTLAGNGTSGDPYVITDAGELQAMNESRSAHYVLGNDIDASNTSTWNNGSGFDPVGEFSSSDRFSGSLDGDGHTVSGLTINRSTEDDVGLLGVMGDGGSITNVTLDNVSVVGQFRVGGLVGRNDEGTIENASTSGNVKGDGIVGGLVGWNTDGSIIENSSAGVTVTGSGSVENIGGLVGINGNGVIENSSATGNVAGDSRVGGLVGQNNVGTVANSSASGTVTGSNLLGGLVGDNGATISNSWATGVVDGQFGQVGGLVGTNEGNVSDSRANGTATGGGQHVGGLVGLNSAGSGVTDSSAAGDVDGTTSAGGLVGTNEGNVENSSATGDVTGTGGFLSGVGGLVGVNDEGIMQPGEAGTIVGSFASGTVNGGDHTGGLVGHNRPNATITTSYASGAVDGDEGVGGLVGENDGNVSTSYAVGPVSGNASFGGLVGVDDAGSSVTNSYWDLNTTNRSASAGGIGLATAEMTGAAAEGNMSFDFASNWTATDEYPHLRWEVRDLTLEVGNVPVDGTAQATVTLALADGSTVTASETASYASDDPSVATVSPGGTVEGVAEGTANVTATLVHSDTETVDVEEGYTVTGRVFDGVFGVPVEGATVTFDDGGNVTETTTNASGAYGVALVEETYNVTAGATLANGRTLVTPNQTTLDLTANTTGFDLTVQDDLAGSGTEDDPYVIETVFELQSMQSNLTAHYVLRDDVDASGTATWNDGAGFDPIGDSSDGFTGSFDGQGYTVSDLSINRSTENGVGLFAAVEPGGSVSNVTLEDVSVSGALNVGGLTGTSFVGTTVRDSSVSGTVTASGNAGGLVGFKFDGAIVNASANVTVVGSLGQVGGLAGRQNFGSIEDSSANGNVTGDSFVGGLVGFSSGGSLSNVSAEGTVEANGSAGGLVGRNGGTIAESRARGDVVGGGRIGGLVGDNLDGTVVNSSAAGTVTGGEQVGGLVGFNDPGSFANDSYATGSVTGDDAVGGLVGDNTGVVDGTYAIGPVTLTGSGDVGGLAGVDDGTVVDSYWEVTATGQNDSSGNATGLATANMTGAAAEGNMNGLDFDGIWAATDDYPRLQWEVQNLTLELAETELGPGGTTQASVMLSLVNGSTVSATETADYTVDNGTVVAVASNGTVTGLSEGAANVTATLVDADTEAVGVLGTSTLSGTVTDGVLGGPVANATVAFDAGTNETVVTTNASGAYDVSLLERTYDVTATATVDGRTLVNATTVDLAGGTTTLNVTLWDEFEESGTVTDPFVIEDVFELQSMQSNHSAHYALGSDVDASGTAGWSGGDGFDPVGDGGSGFIGSFDGRHHEISDLTIDRGAEDEVGLFGYAVDSTIENVHLENASVAGGATVGTLVGDHEGGTVANSSANGTVEGEVSVGGLVGGNDEGGTIVNSSAGGHVESGIAIAGGLAGENDEGTITNSSSSGTVTGDDLVGGLVGENDEGTIVNSSASGDVDGDDPVGGLVGGNDGGFIVGSSARGNVAGEDLAGGLVGVNEMGFILNSWAGGDVDGDEPVGGLVGVNVGVIITDSYATGNVTGNDAVGGLVGLNEVPGQVTDSYATGAVAGNDTVGGLVGRNNGAVARSYAVGLLTGNASPGGLVGGNGTGSSVTDSYWDLNATGQDTSAGTGAVELTTAEMTGTAAEGNVTGFDFDGAWTATDDYPHLRWAVSDLDLELGSTTLEPGDATGATVTLTLADGSTVTATTVANYTSDDEGVATVADGVVTTHGTGGINVTAEHGGLADAASLSVQSAGSGDGSGLGPGSGGWSGAGGGSGSSGGDDGGALSLVLVDGEGSVDVDEAILSVEIVFADEDASGTVAVETFAELPAGAESIPDATGTGVAFVDVTVPPALTDSDATIRMTLEEAALGDVDPTDLAIYHYEDGEWTTLETTVVSAADGEIVVEATTPGFSLFAVAPAPQQPTPDDQPTTPDDTTPDGETSTPGPGQSSPDDDESGGESAAPSGVTLVVVLIAVAVLMGLALAVARRRS